MIGDLTGAPVDAATAPIVVFDGVMSEILDDLAEAVLERSDAPDAVSFGSRNVGGWKSREDFFAWRSIPATIARLRTVIWDACVARIGDQGSLVGWAMVNRNGSYHQPHSHGGKLAGIYYVTSGDPPVPTIFERVSTDAPPGSIPIDDIQIDPVPGRLITFPARRRHRVPQYDGEVPRITIAFEVRP